MEVSFDIVPHTVRVSTGVSGDGRSFSIRFQGFQTWRKSLRDASGRELRSLPWEISLHDESQLNEYARTNGAIGLAWHIPESEDLDFPHGESFTAWAALPSDTMEFVIGAWRAGRLPARIDFSARGPEYGWEPDGSGVVWDVEGRRDTFISGVSVHWRDGHADEDKELAHPEVNTLPPLPSIAFSPDCAALVAMSRWLVALAAAGVAVLIFK